VPDGIDLATLPDDCDVVVFPAEIDVCNAEIAFAALSAVLERGVRLVVADMTRSVFCDCSGVNALLGARRLAVRAGAELRVVTRNSQVHRLFDLTGAASHLAVFPDVGAALAGAAQASFPDGG
jgi:anti-anti-sigma factor